MTKPLRTAHRCAWLFIALLLPAVVIYSWLVIPNSIPVNLLPANQPAPLPQIAGQKETKQYCLNIRTNTGNTAWQIEWRNKLPLTVPSALLYVDQTKLIGRIEASGKYVFPLEVKPGNVINLTVYDFIHEIIIDSINLSINRPRAG